MKIKLAHRLAYPLGITLSTILSTAALATDPINPVGWTSNIQLGTPLPGGLYFVDTATYIDRSGPNLSSGLRQVDAAVNIPAFAWSTPFDFLGGHVEALAMTPELSVDVNPGGPNSSSARAFYNPTAYVGEAWNLGHGFGVSEFVGAFFPVNTEVGALGLGGNVLTFVDIVGLSYNNDGWALSANFYYGHSGNDLNTGIHSQADTATVDFAAVKHIDKWELGLVGNAGTDVSNTLDNDFGAHPFSEISLGGLVGYSFGPVTTEIYAVRSVEARNQTAGGYDTRVYGRVIVPLWNPPTPAPAIAKY